MPSVKSYWKKFGPISMEVKHNGSIFYSWMDDNVKFHQPTTFSTLTHVTSLENTESILQEGFKMQVVGDYSCVNKLSDKRGKEHPLIRTPFFWMAPDNHETTTAIRYGNVAFSLKKLDKLKGLRFYYVEFLDYVTKTAARILLTTKDYDHLFHRFDPTDTTMDGKIPVMFDGTEWYRYTSFSNSRNDEILLDIEFILDITPSQQDLVCRYVKCFDPRPIVTTYGKVRGCVKVYNGNLDVFRLVSLLARYQGYHAYELSMNVVVVDLIQQIQAVRTDDHFFPEQSLHDIFDTPGRKKTDFIFQQIDFAKVFDMKEYSSNDWKSIQILDFIYHESNAIPNVQTMLNVLARGISGMKSERTVFEVFTLFFQAFLSSTAKKCVKKALINILFSL